MHDDLCRPSDVMARWRWLGAWAAVAVAALALSACQKQAQATRSEGSEQKATTAAASDKQIAPTVEPPSSSKDRPVPAADDPGHEQEAARTPDGYKLSASPSLPFVMWASHRGEVEPGKVTPLVFTLQASAEFQQVKTQARALKGLLLSGELVRDHQRLDSGGKVRHTVQVRADEGVAGYVVVDVSWAGGPMGAGSTTVGVEIRAKGAEQKLEKLGRIETDSSGNRVQVMPAQMK